MHRAAAVACLLVSPVVIATCAPDVSGPGVPVPAAIAVVSGDGQIATVGTPLLQPLVARVTAADGTPVEGVTVSWQVRSGGATLSAAAIATDSGGRAAVFVTLGTRAGSDADTIQASVTNVGKPVAFTASATPAAAARMLLASGNGQTGTVGKALGDSLVVLVRDAYDNQVPGTSVAWSVIAGSGVLSAATTVSDAAGRAAVSWTLGTAAGVRSDSAMAGVAGLAGSPVIFVADAAPGPASLLERASGDAQTGTVGTALADSLVVIARDQYGNPVAGAAVTWTTAEGTVSAAMAPTNAAGRSAVRWTLGGLAGAQQATATLRGAAGSPLTFGATADPGAPAALAFLTHPNATPAGATIAPAILVAIMDAFGNAVPAAPDPVSLAMSAGSGAATLAGTTQGAPVEGVVTFPDLHIDQAGSGYTLVATAAGLPAASSAPFDITPAGSPRLSFIVQPGDATAGAAWSIQVSARDSLGNTFTDFTAEVTLAIATNPAGGTLSGTLTVAAIAGVATFSGLTIDRSGAGYALAATASGAAAGSSASFDVTAGPATRLAFTAQPTSTFQGSAISPAVEVSARDAYDNPVTGFTGDVTLAIGTNPTGGTLSGTTTVAAVAGVAAFPDLRIDSAGSGFTLVANASGLASDASGPFAVVRLEQFTRLAFAIQPSDAVAGQALAPAVTVTALDQVGNPATAFAGTVTIALAANPAAATLSGGTSAVAVAGVATFDDLRLDKLGSGYRLRASAAGLVPDTSAAFAVRAGPPARLTALDGLAQTAPAGTALPLPYSVAVRDSFDNPVAGAVVTWSVTAGGGSLTPAQAATDSTGAASAVHTLGLHAGGQSATAAVVALPDSLATFTATATPNGTITGTITTTSGFLAPAASQTTTSAGSDPAPAYVPDELIVTYRASALGAPPVGSPALAAPAAAAALGRAIRDRLAATSLAARFAVRGVSPALLAARLRVHDSTALDAIADAVRRDPAVESVERNAIVHLEARGAAASSAPTLPGDPLYAHQAWHYGMVDLPRAWAITTGSAAVLVAVVDNGIRYDHPAVAANLTHDGYDFVSSASVKLCTGGGTIDNAGDGDAYDADPTQPADYDMDYTRNCAIGLTTSGNHGLHVAGTIGAVGNDGVSVTGVNWSVRIRPVRVLGTAGSGTYYDIAQGILYAGGLPADDGHGGTVSAPSAARVINLSLGGSSSNTTLHNAVIAATSAGALVVAAAGNSGNTSLLYPAAFPEALSVSAVGPDGVLASYSSYGSTVDIAAPGGDIADGDASFGVYSATWNFVSGAPAYDSWNGTSMATPHVSGVAALVLAQNPSLGVAELRARLTTYAVDVGASGRDDLYGAGIVNARNSLTQTLAPPAATFARLYGAGGLLLATAPVAPDGSFAFTGLGDGGYTVYAGTDEDGDGQVGVPGRLWGAWGGPATPAAITVDGAAIYPASFSIALPLELEPNDAAAQANALPVGGYLQGTIGASSDVDTYRVRIPQPGTYTFETSAVNGACGFALEANTMLTLRDSSGTTVAWNDDIDAAALDFCSRITLTLTPGTYTAAVSDHSGKRYRLAVRVGS